MGPTCTGDPVSHDVMMPTLWELGRQEDQSRVGENWASNLCKPKQQISGSPGACHLISLAFAFIPYMKWD
jgi:hypothetical protein